MGKVEYDFFKNIKEAKETIKLGQGIKTNMVDENEEDKENYGEKVAKINYGGNK